MADLYRSHHHDRKRHCELPRHRRSGQCFQGSQLRRDQYRRCGTGPDLRIRCHRSHQRHCECHCRSQRNAQQPDLHHRLCRWHQRQRHLHRRDRNDQERYDHLHCHRRGGQCDRNHLRCDQYRYGCSDSSDCNGRQHADQRQCESHRDLRCRCNGYRSEPVQP